MHLASLPAKFIKVVNGRIARNLIEPGTETIFRIVRFYLGKCLLEALDDYILRFLFLGHYPIGMHKDSVLVAVVQQ